MKTKKIRSTKTARPEQPGIPYDMLADFMGHIPDVIYFKDTKGKLVLVNKAHARGLGLTPEEVIGKTDFDIFPPKKARKMAKDDQLVITSGKSIIDKIEKNTRADGIDNYSSTTKIPRFDPSGKIIGLIGITRDITRRFQLDHLRNEKIRIEQKLARLEELNNMTFDFLGFAAHELRTPLAIIKEAVSILSEEICGPLSAPQKKFLADVQRQIKRLNNLIDELLDISHIESSRFRLHYSLVNFNDLIKDFTLFYEKQAGRKNIKLEYHLPRHPVNIFLDAGRINQVITNLLNNAVKYTEPGGKITLKLNIVNDRIRITVTDTGIGIDKKTLPLLFNKFTQASKTAAGSGGGVGLGLSIVKELIHKHNGEIWAESRLSRGSKFYFTLPFIYTTNILEPDTRNRINNLITRGKSIYFINLLIINYSDFRKNIKTDPQKLFLDLKNIINIVFKEYCHRDEEKPQIVHTDYQNGECSILFPSAGEKKIAEVCSSLKNKVDSYFARRKFPNIFINLGYLSYDRQSTDKAREQLLTDLRIKKIYIGSEIRRFKRFQYNADIEIVSPASKKKSLSTIDISEGGICFTHHAPMKTDARVQVFLQIPRDKKPLLLPGRVAWLSQQDNIIPAEKEVYKIGIEFINLTKQKQNLLKNLIKSLSSTPA